MEVKKNKYVLISNRGPNFTSGSKFHRGMGGTKEIYASLMERFCQSWICLASLDLKSEKVVSPYGKQLDVLFVDKDDYNEYYYKYVSEYLYPMLLGFPERALKNPSSQSFKKVIKLIHSELENKFKGQDLLICDYHLYQIPELVTWKCRKIFLWFIPFLTKEYYFPQLKEIVRSLNECDELYVFNDVWVQNFKDAFKYYFPNGTLKVNVKPILMGPDMAYFETSKINISQFYDLIENKLSIQKNTKKRYIISASRMDYVKNLPLLIEGFKTYLANNPKDKVTDLILIAPHHRRDSELYVAEERKIAAAVTDSKYKDRIHMTHDYFNFEELRVMFKYCSLFVCPSRFDAMPLTPLEYVLANLGEGGVIICKGLGSEKLLFPNCLSAENNETESVAEKIEEFFRLKPLERKNRMQSMKNIVSNFTLDKSMDEFEFNLRKL